MGVRAREKQVPPHCSARAESAVAGRGHILLEIAHMKTLAAVAPFLIPLVSVAAAHAEPLHTSGRRLLDACGNPFVVRGVEQILGEQLPPGNDWVGLVDSIADSG